MSATGAPSPDQGKRSMNFPWRRMVWQKLPDATRDRPMKDFKLSPQQQASQQFVE
jgi:hypothetical protein